MLTAPDELKPEDSFEVVVQMGDGKPAQLTLSVVDEGLLDITQFPTTDPWRAVFQQVAFEAARFRFVWAGDRGQYRRCV